MRVPSAAEMLTAWERGLTLPPAARALTLLTAAEPETSTQSLAALTIGQRDGRLMSLRAKAFGPDLLCLVTCPQCGERAEFTFNLDDIHTGESLSTNSDGATDSVGSNGNTARSLEIDEYFVRFRLPNSEDLTAITERHDANQARDHLLDCCLMEIRRQGQSIETGALPQTVIEAIVERMALADPLADININMTCPVCEHEWLAPFDIASYLWTEIDAWARRMLRDVHRLAKTYHWHEADILAMSPQRRQAYLELAGT